MHKGSISACLHTSEIQRNKNDFAAFEYEIDLELCYFLPENKGRKRCFCYSFINVYKRGSFLLSIEM